MNKQPVVTTLLCKQSILSPLIWSFIFDSLCCLFYCYWSIQVFAFFISFIIHSFLENHQFSNSLTSNYVLNSLEFKKMLTYMFTLPFLTLICILLLTASQISEQFFPVVGLRGPVWSFRFLLLQLLYSHLFIFVSALFISSV